VSSTVIVVSHKLHDWLAGCIISVLDQADEVLVVDNGSVDGQVGNAATAAGARVLRLPRNTGFTGGVNAGIAAVRTDLIALLNDDAAAGAGWLSTAGRVLEDTSIAAVSPKLLFAHPYGRVRLDEHVHNAPGDPRPLGRRVTRATVDGKDVLDRLAGPGIHALEYDGSDRWRWTSGSGSIYVPLERDAKPAAVEVEGQRVAVEEMVDLVNSAGSYLHPRGYSGDIGVEQPDGPAFDQPVDRFGACGAALVTRAATVRQLGGLANQFFGYFEDIDWCWRAQLAGLRIRYEPAAVVRHAGGLSFGGMQSLRVRQLYGRNRLLCLLRNAPIGIARPEVQEVLLHESRLQVPGLRRSLAAALPRAVAERAALSRRWRRRPGEVWDQWVGVNAPP
jgi:GT2 family glycosyltransferase